MDVDSLLLNSTRTDAGNGPAGVPAGEAAALGEDRRRIEASEDPNTVDDHDDTVRVMEDTGSNQDGGPFARVSRSRAPNRRRSASPDPDGGRERSPTPEQARGDHA